MDSDIVFLLAVGGFYLLRHLMGAKRKPAPGGPAPGRPAPLPPLPGENEGQPDPEFDEALLEIRRALGMPVPDSRRESPVPSGNQSRSDAPTAARPRVLSSSPAPVRPRPTPRQTSLPSRIPARPNRRPQRVEDEFRDPATARKPQRVDNEFHNPSAPRAAVKTKANNDPFAWHDPLAEHSHVDAKPEVVKTAAKPPHPLHARLKSREALREALLLREILGPPLSRRRS